MPTVRIYTQGEIQEMIKKALDKKDRYFEKEIQKLRIKIIDLEKIIGDLR